MPQVSVVIPTYRRPQLVVRAVHSALGQTLTDIEVIVVNDGADIQTQEILATVTDKRLRVIELPENQGCRAARQIGVDAAQSRWVASLDDDDEWMPQKLARQLEAAQDCECEHPVISCYAIVRTSLGDTISPRREPNPNESIDEYLFVRNSPFQGEGLIQCSTIFTTKELLQKVPRLDTHEDWDWIIRASQYPGVKIQFVREALSIWYQEHIYSQQSLSRSFTWLTSLNWIREIRDLVTPRAYSSFILAEVASRAAKENAWSAFLPLLIEAVNLGQPTPKDIAFYLGMWFFPGNFRRWLRHILYAKKTNQPTRVSSPLPIQQVEI